ncbi:hypothetical protein [Streptomyces sp. NBC_01304]|uniref:hypothetical protein n=1 Tax=Streptomyces sp. NBC_01304 TaxID=2903818 RepID=UPI002E107711|nr:hypothetical protein OG430_23930 [Streptomyces sp. NBC_01304]
MQPSDDALDEALASPERVPAHSTRLGGKELGPQVQSWKVERAYATDLPEAMRAFSGSASAQLELQLGGAAGVNAPRLYSAWADRTTGDVVRPGQSVVHTAGAGSRTLPAFRGTVRSRSAASGSDTVTVQALDGAERLRGPASLPRPYHGYYWGYPVATATWCVDELLRQGGIHTCPPPRAPEADKLDEAPFTVLYASLHGGFNSTYGQPEVLPHPATYDWIRDGAPFEIALMPKAAGLTASWMPRSRFVLPGKTFQVECWANTALARGNTVELTALFDRSGGAYGSIKASFDTSTGVVAISSGTKDGTSTTVTWGFPKLQSLKGNWHLGMTVQTASSGGTVYPTVQPRLTSPDGSYHRGGVYTFSAPASAQPRAELFRIDLTTDMAVECLQVTDRVWADSESYTREAWEQQGEWAKGAVLDTPELPLYDIPKVSGSQWDAITEIARASMSTAEFDEQGIFRWRGPGRFAKVPADPDLTVTTSRDIASLTVTEEIDACRNYCEQPYQDWTGIRSATGDPVDDTAVRELKPNVPVDVKYALAEEENDIGPLLVVDDSAPSEGHRVRFGTAATGGSSVKGTVTVSCWREGPLYVVRFTNRGTSSVWTVTKDGKPSVRIVPQKRTADPKQRRWAWLSPSSQQFYGKQQYVAPASDWVQTQAASSTLSQAMLNAGRYPVPVLGEVDVLHDPRIQLGDVVRVVDSAGAELDTLAWVVGLRITHTAGAAPQQVLTLRGTAYNGAPADAGLTPDGPVDPLYGKQRTYLSVTAGYATLEALTTSAVSYRTLLETTGAAA